MNRLPTFGRIALSLALLALGVGGFFLMGTPQVETRPPDRAQPPLVQTVVAREHADGIQFEVDGLVVPYRQVDIASEVSGRIEFKSDHCRTGKGVKQGEVLVRIDQSDYQLEVRRLTEELAQADAMLKESDVEMETVENQIASMQQQLEIDQRQRKRAEDLLSRRAASGAEVDTARRTEVATNNSLQQLQDQKNLIDRRRIRLESAKVLQQANLEKAQLSLQRTEIRAPFDGVVVSESVEQDGFVQLGSTVIRLQDSTHLDVTCKLHMRQMHWLWQSDPSPSEQTAGESAEQLSDAYDFPDTPATVIYQLGGTSYQWQGVVNRYDGAGVDNQTRMVPCRVYVSDPRAVSAVHSQLSNGAVGNPPTLMTGMFVKVRIDANPSISLIKLPQEAIQPGNSVWTVEDGRLKRKEVLIASSDAQSVIAYDQPGGLTAGNAVVVSPLANPLDGLPVTQWDESESAAESLSPKQVDSSDVGGTAKSKQEMASK